MIRKFINEEKNKILAEQKKKQSKFEAIRQKNEKIIEKSLYRSSLKFLQSKDI